MYRLLSPRSQELIIAHLTIFLQNKHFKMMLKRQLEFHSSTKMRFKITERQDKFSRSWISTFLMNVIPQNYDGFLQKEILHFLEFSNSWVNFTICWQQGCLMVACKSNQSLFDTSAVLPFLGDGHLTCWFTVRYKAAKE